MTFSYAAPGVTDKDTVRFLLQDTNPDEALVSDEEIQYAIATWGPLYQNSLYYVASTLAETIAARYAREASYSADGVSISLGPVGDQFRELAMALRNQYDAQLVGASVDVGGITPNETLQPDTKPFSFGKGIHDYIDAGPQEYGGVYPPDQDITGYVPEYARVVEP